MNRTRLEILEGLRDPTKNFPPQGEGDADTAGACVSNTQEGVGPSRSTVSDYLVILRRTGLVEVRRVGQRIYYKRNEASIRAPVELIDAEP